MSELQAAANPAVIEVEGSIDQPWDQFILKHQDGIEIAAVERNPVAEGKLGAEEIEEFLEEIPLHQPQSAVTWLVNYLRRVKVIYAFQLLSGTEVNDGWTPLHHVYNTVWKFAGGILQADGEGFSNEDGASILWQFSDSVSGAWNVGVLNGNQWVHFEMELGDRQHREAFWAGQVPAGAKIIT
ncbi:MAG TPA: hypothetical protein VFB63_20425 [Bryobacteraceae bacterium]|nr:hypothetical protein [Bryobacteraceae bacterium]